MSPKACYTLLLTVTSALMVIGCGTAVPPPANPEQQPQKAALIRVSGSGTVLPLVAKLADVFTKRHPEVRFEFDAGTNTSGGVKGLSQDVFQIAVANRALSEAENALGAVYRPFGRDALVFAAHEGAGVAAVTSEGVRAVYAGDSTTWSQLGGVPRPIVVLDRDEEETARKFGLVPFMAEQSIKAKTIVLSRAKEMLDGLSSTADSLGYTTLSQLRVAQLQGVKIMRLDGVQPSPSTVTNGSYPLHLTLGVVHKPEPRPEVASFIDFIFGKDGRAVLEAYDVAPN